MAIWLALISLACPQSAAARKAAKEVVETFAREAIERAEPRVAALIDAYGDDAARVLRRVGAPGVAALEKHGAAGLRILSRWGDDGIRLLASEGDDAVRMLAAHGDDGISFMIRHPGVGRDLLGHFGRQALKSDISTESVILLNRLAEPIKSSGRSEAIFGVVERFGDRACQFLWRHKGTIFAAAVLASFLADPQPYLDGVKQLVVEPATRAAEGAVGRTDWTLVFIALGLAAMAGLAARHFIRARKASRKEA
jgi:hypothetical protein